ncbi:MAG: rane protein [Rhodocyclales bacterium]|nr:rane protein [Rhodocyclales bacterium]
MFVKRWFRRSTDSAANDTATAAPDLIGDSTRLLATFLLHMRTRLELLGIELAIEKSRLIRSVVAGVLTGFFALMTLCLGVVYVLASYWDTPYRLVAVAWLMFAAFVLTMVAGIFLYQRLRVPSVLFSASAAELGRDVEALENV